MKKTFFYLLFILALASCNNKSTQQSSPTQLPIDFQTVVASDRIYRVVVDIDGNVWHWVSSNPHQDPQNEFVYTNKNLPTKPQKIETLSNIVSVSLSDGTAIAVTGDGLCFKWEYYGSEFVQPSTYNIFAYNEQPKQVNTAENVKYAYSDFVYFVWYNAKEGFDDVDMDKGLFIVHNDGTAEFLNSNGKRNPIKLPGNDKIRYMTEFMILSESGKVYCVRASNYEKVEININLVAKNCLFVQLFPTGGSVFQKDGKQSRLWIEAVNDYDVATGGELKTNIKFWGRSSYNTRHIRYDGVLLDCLGNVLKNADINNLIYLSDDLYLRADGTLFESTGGKYEETSMEEGGNVTPRRLFGDEIRRVENIKIYTTNLIENLPSKPGTFTAKPEDIGRYYSWNQSKYGSSQTSTTWETDKDPSPIGWRVPTFNEIRKLTNTKKVTSEWTQVNGVNGKRYTDKKSSKSIFMPAAGRLRMYMINVGADPKGFVENAAYGYYWSNTAEDRWAWALLFCAPSPSDIYIEGTRIQDFMPVESIQIYTGLPIRCVAK